MMLAALLYLAGAYVLVGLGRWLNARASQVYEHLRLIKEAVAPPKRRCRKCGKLIQPLVWEHPGPVGPDSCKNPYPE